MKTAEPLGFNTRRHSVTTFSSWRANRLPLILPIFPFDFRVDRVGDNGIDTLGGQFLQLVSAVAVDERDGLDPYLFVQQMNGLWRSEL